MYRSWPLIAAGFLLLLLLVAIASAELLRRSASMEEETRVFEQQAFQLDQLVRELRAERYRVGLLARELMMAPDSASHVLAVTEMAAARERSEELYAELARSLPEKDEMTRIRESLDATWARVEPLLDEKRQRLGEVDRASLGRLREEFLDLTRDLGQLIRSLLTRQQQEAMAKRKQFEKQSQQVFLATVLMGLLVAVGTIWRTSALERRSARLHAESIRTERELRSLSSRLVSAQEDERRRISRELHDEIGQILTALRLELGQMERLGERAPEAFSAHATEAKTLAESAMRAIRDMALSLRPSMLDDLGLAPALEWQAREFTRRTQIPVEIRLEGDMELLPEPHRTCVYRVLQEALTNCAKHSHASLIQVTVHGHKDHVSLSVQDDGLGFTQTHTGRSGLGLIGMEERVKELNGKLSVISRPNRGTLLKAEIPVPQGQAA
jgi:signal transduction histidine kinase